MPDKAMRLALLLAPMACAAGPTSDSSALPHTDATTASSPDTDTPTGSTDTGTDSEPGTSTTAAGSSGGVDEPIGTLNDTGTRNIDQSTTNPPACDDACEQLGGWCDDAQAGRSYYDCGPTSRGGVFYSCAWPEDAEYIDAEGDLCTLTEYSCTCHDVPVDDPTVDVLASEGLFSCDVVCESWGLVCDGGGSAYDMADQPLAELDCDTVPNESVQRYVCLCRA